MRCNTPPPSEGDEEFDIGDYEEVIELNDNDDIEAVLNQMEDGSMDADDDDEDEDREITEMATKIFTMHEKSVFCCALSPCGNLAVTGGEDDLAYVWEIDSGNVNFTCHGHKDSVVAVEFSFDGKYLASADMGGYIQVWKVETGNKVWECEESGDLNWIKWHHACNVLVAGASDGSIWKWLIPHSPEYTQSFGVSGISTHCGTISHNGKFVIVGYENGSMRVFDLKSGKCVFTVQDTNAHTDAVTCVLTHHNNSILLSSSMDGTAKLYNIEKQKVIGTLDCRLNPSMTDPNSEEGSSQISHSVEAISIQPSSNNVAVTATLAGIITIWDISSLSVRHHIAQGCGTSQLSWHPNEPILFTGGLDGILRCYDARAGEPLAKFTGHRKSILSLSVSKDGSTILTTSDDGTGRIFRMETEST